MEINQNKSIDGIKNKKKRGRKILGIVFVVLINLGIVAYILIKELSDNGGDKSKFDITSINVLFLLLGILCFGVALFAEFRKYRKMILSTGGRLDRRGSFEVASIGKYADNITPLGAGGQPFQIHYLHKRGYPGSAATTVTLNGFISQQISFILIAIVILIISPKSATDSVSSLKIMSYIGLGFYCMMPLMILLFALIPRPFGKIVVGVLKFGQKLHIVKDYENTSVKFLKGLGEYVFLIKQSIRKPTFLLPVLFWSLVYQFAILSIPFFSILAFNGSIDWWSAFSITVYIYLAITIIPTPGNSGVAEGSFYLVFSSLQGGALFWGMIFWRALVYYSWIVIGLFVVFKTAVKNSYMHKKEVPSDRPLNICLTCDTYFPVIDGVIRTIDQYAREMVKMGHRVVVVAPHLEGSDDEKLPYEVYRLPQFKVPGIPFEAVKPFMSRKVRKQMDSYNFDVIHIHSPMILGKMMQRYGRKRKIPVFTTFHSKYYDDTLHLTHSKLLASIMVKYILHFYHRVDSVWACSASTGETLKSYGYNGHIGVMENGVENLPEGNVEEFKKDALENYQIPANKKLLLFVGQQIWHKNLKMVLDTTKALCDENDIYHTIIVGVGYDEDSIKKYSHDIGIDDKVTFVGKIRSRKALFGLYELCDIFFFPSLYDNAPLVVREAALAGLPSLLVKGSNASEIIVDDQNGYLAENTVESMSSRIKEAFASGRLKEVGKKASETIPVPWKTIVERVIDRYISETKHPLG